MALKSVPLTPRERWWTRLAKMPGRLWSTTREVADFLTDRSRRQPSRRKLILIRVAVMAFLLMLLPVMLLFPSRPRHSTAFDALYARVREIWETSPTDALALLRSTFEQLISRGGFTKMKAVEIAPFGRFETIDMYSVHRFLYDCEVASGDFERALAVAAAMPARLVDNILQQVDCLVALDRKKDAIALLERNLDLDGWRGKLRRRLVELGGSPLRTVN